jgi:hypothetical protein
MLTIVWVRQAPELLDALTALRAPTGATTPRTY